MINHGIYTDTDWIRDIFFVDTTGAPLSLPNEYQCDILSAAGGTVLYSFKSSGAGAGDGTITKPATGTLRLTSTEVSRSGAILGKTGAFPIHLFDVTGNSWAAEGTIMIGPPGAASTYIMVNTATNGAVISSQVVGVPGPVNVLTIGSVTTGAPGSAASVNISGAAPAQVLNFTLPRGADGANADVAAAVYASVGSVSPAMATLLLNKVGYLWDCNVQGALFSDAGATVVAQPGDRVLVMQDLSGRGNHMAKHASYAAPYLREDARGYRYLEWVGNVEDRVLDAPAGGNAAEMFAAAVIRPTIVSGTIQQIFTAFNGTDAGWMLGASNQASFTVYRAGGNTAPAQNIANIVPSNELFEVGEIAMVSGSYEGGAASKWRNRHRGMRTAGVYTPSASPVIRMGHNIHNSVGEANMSFYAGAVFAEALTVAEQEIVHAYLQSVTPQNGRAKSALSILKNKIEMGAGDAGVLMVSDSLGDGAEELFMPLAARFAARYPAFGVNYVLANYTGNAWQTQVIQPASNGRTISFYAAAQSGGVGRRFFADRFPLISGLAAVDLLLSNVGKNLDDSLTDAEIRGEYLSFIEQFRGVFPAAGVAALLQPPDLYDPEEEAKYRVLRGIAADWKQLQLLDVASAWKAAGSPPDFYEDFDSNAMHPALGDIYFSNGAAFITDFIMAAYERQSTLAGTPGTRMLAATNAGLLLNARFAAWAGAVPDNWTVGSGAVAKDAAIFDSGTYSAKVTGAGSFLYQDVAAGALSTVTVFARTRGSTDATSGQVALEWRNAGGAVVQTDATTGDGGSATSSHAGAFCHAMVAGAVKPATAVTLRVKLIGSAAGGWFNDIMLLAGNTPASFV